MPSNLALNANSVVIGVVGSDVRRRPQLRAVFADLYCYFLNTGAEGRTAPPEKKVSVLRDTGLNLQYRTGNGYLMPPTESE
jgi:hypothetical protein